MSHNRCSDEGFSLIELLVVVLLLGIVVAILFGTLTSLTGTSASTSSREAALSDARLALETITRDLRAANPIDAIPPTLPTSTYDNAVGFSVYCSSGAGCSSNVRPVAYSVSGGSLTRTVGGSNRIILGPTGGGATRRGQIMNTSSQPVFTYFEKSGAVIPTSTAVGVGRPASYFRDCTKKVQIHLVVEAEANHPSSVIDLVTAVNLRNYNEVNPC